MNEIYADFLTEAEVTQILDNRDIWMDGEEVVERMNKRMKTMQEAAELALALKD